MSFKLYTPCKGADGMAYGYVNPAARAKLDWVQRSYISSNDAFMTTPSGSVSMRNNLSWDGVGSEAYLDDVLSADPSPNNPMAARNEDRVAYGYIPFILENSFDALVYDLGFKFYTDLTSPDAAAVYQGNAYTYYKFADRAGAASQRMDAFSFDDGFNALDEDSVGVFVLGVMSAADWQGGTGTEADRLKTLSSTAYWVKRDGTGTALSGTVNNQDYGTLSVRGNRVILTPASYQDAMTWWQQGNVVQSIENENGMTISGYRVKHWSDGTWRCRYSGAGSIITKGITLTDPNQSIRVPTGGVVWGYFTVTVTDGKTLATEVSTTGGAYKVTAHGKWNQAHLATATGIYTTGIVEPWNPGGAAVPSRLWRYGVHFVGKKE